jgi:hypothetical protein
LIECYDRQTVVKEENVKEREDIRDELTKDEMDRTFDQFVRSLRDKAQVEVLL